MRIRRQLSILAVLCMLGNVWGFPMESQEGPEKRAKERLEDGGDATEYTLDLKMDKVHPFMVSSEIVKII